MGQVLSGRQANCLSLHLGNGLAEAPAAERRGLDHACVVRWYDPGEVVFSQGDECRGIHCVGQGLVGLRRDDAGGRSLLVKLAAPGEALGYQSLAAAGEQPYTAEAIMPTRVCYVKAPAMRRVLDTVPAMGREVLHRAAVDLERAEERLLNYGAFPVHLRLAHLLMILARHTGADARHGPVEMTVPLSRADMAGMIGACPETVSRAARRLEADGIARFSGPYGRRLSIPSLATLIDRLEPLGLD